MVTMQHVRFAYPRRSPLFDGLAFRIEPGSVVGLLGKNGAGKTTLLKLAVGLLFPQSGDIRLFGAEAARRRPAELARLAMIPEQFGVPGLRISEAVAFAAGYYPRFDHSLLTRCLERFEVSGDDRLTQLSYGQQKKVLLSIAIASGAELVMLDEPTNGLDIPSKQVLRSLIAEAADDRRSFVISTHQVRDVENLIDPIVVLDEGRVVFSSPLAAIADGVEMRRYRDPADAERDGAFALETRLGSAVALVPRTADPQPAEARYGEIDLELLFQAAVNAPERLSAACGGAS